MTMKFKANEESVNSINTMAHQITEIICEMKEQAEKVRVMVDERENMLGPHAESLYAALEDVHMSIKRASNPAEDIAKGLTEIAETCQKIIEEYRR